VASVWKVLSMDKSRRLQAEKGGIRSCGISMDKKSHLQAEKGGINMDKCSVWTRVAPPGGEGRQLRSS